MYTERCEEYRPLPGCQVSDYYHHHCRSCGAWQFGPAEPDVYGYGECYSCATNRLDRENK